jgi:K+-transporting ATPase c subunit
MELEELKKKFIVDDDVLKTRLEPVVTKALHHCVIDKTGQVHINNKALSSKQRVMLTMAARAVASQLDSNISPDVPITEIAKATGLPDNQIRARINDIVKEKFARSSQRGSYEANPHRVEAFLDSLPRPK